MANEADTCRRFVKPTLQVAGWDTEPHRPNEQATFSDYILRYRPDVPIAVVEAMITVAEEL